MGETALGTLLDNLGRRTTRAVNYENAAICGSSSAIAIDGHAVRSCSDENDLGEAGYTQEKFEQSKEKFGVYVLQSNAALSAEKVFAGYKKRWGIKTFYQYLKNKGNFNDLMIQDCYKEQGLAL